MQTGDGKTYMHLGAPNHDGDGFVVMTKGMERKEIIGGQQLFISAKDHPTITGIEKNVEDATDSTDKLDATAGAQTSGAIVTDIINEQEVYSFPKEPLDKADKGTFTRKDELKGEELFERRIGEKHFWSDGDEFYYGGGDVYGFGGGVSEDHAARICDSDDGKVSDYKVEDKLKGKWDHETSGKAIGLSSDDINSTLIEKTWGSTISYQNGNNYAWGDGADYNFGNGYEESLVSETEINKNYSHDKAGSGGTGFNTINSESKGPGSISSIKMKEDTVCVEKMIGDTYAFTKGNTIEVTDGDSHSYQYGDGYDFVDGDSHEYIDGNSYSEVHGNSKDRYWGDTDEHVFGRADSMVIGGTADMFVGGQTEFCFAARLNVDIGNGFEYSGGARILMDAGLRVEISTTAKTEVEVVKIKNALTNLKTHATSLNTSGSNLRTFGSAIKCAGAAIATGALTMFA